MKMLEILRAQRDEIETWRSAVLELMNGLAETAATETRGLKPDEDAEFDRLRAHVAEIDKPIVEDGELAKINERIAELEAIEQRTQDAAKRPELQIMRRVEVDTDTDVRYMRPGEVRDMALKVLETEAETVALRDDQATKVEGLMRRQDQNVRGDDIARRMIVTENDAYRSAWMKLVTQPTPVLTAEESVAVQRFMEFRAMSIGTDSAGGYGVPVLIDPSIILTAQGSLNPFRRIARQETITTKAWKGVSSAGVSWSYDAEASAVSDDSPTLAQPSVTAFMARGFIPYSIEVGMDYPGFAIEMARLLAEGYDELQADKFARGSGNGEPRGILTALDANTNVEVVVTTDGAFGGVDIGKAWVALPDRYKGNATWVMSHGVGEQVAGFGNGNNLSFVTVDLTGVAEKIRNRPIEFSSYFPDFTGTTGAANISVVGDFRNMLIVDRAGMEVELVPHLFDVTNNRPTGQRGWFAHARNGADSINDLGFRLLQNQ